MSESTGDKNWWDKLPLYAKILIIVAILCFVIMILCLIFKPKKTLMGSKMRVSNADIPGYHKI